MDKKGFDIKVLDLRKLTSIADYFVICTASVEVHAKAIADWILESLEKEGVRAWHSEGYGACRWILLDYVDVVIHIFLKDVRDFYALEKLWGDAPVKEIREKPPSKKRRRKT